MNKAKRSESLLTDLLNLRSLAIQQHYYCEDCWYTCPEHEEGCCDDMKPKKCDCGANKHNEEVEALYKKIIEQI